MTWGAQKRELYVPTHLGQQRQLREDNDKEELASEYIKFIEIPRMQCSYLSSLTNHLFLPQEEKVKFTMSPLLE